MDVYAQVAKASGYLINRSPLLRGYGEMCPYCGSRLSELRTGRFVDRDDPKFAARHSLDHRWCAMTPAARVITLIHII